MIVKDLDQRESRGKKMDKILVLKHGKIIEQGTYRDLLRKRGHFYKIWKKQGGWK